MTKILIAGIGGVGGYFGGLLAKAYQTSEEVHISFLARGKNLEAIKAFGLTVVRGNETWVVQPKIVSDQASDIGPVDLLLLCTKSYDLAETIEQLRPCIGSNTIILPLLNGVDNRTKIQSLCPDNLVLDGCVYIVARLTAPGRVENLGNVETLFFGTTNVDELEQLRSFEQIFRAAQIQATLSDKILSLIWEKFIFISPTASATSYFDRPIGAIMADVECTATITLLIDELITLAQALKISFADNIKEQVLQRLRSLPYDTTSSMHTDFQQKKQHTELEALTGYALRAGKELGLAMPTYEKVYNNMRTR